MRAILACLLFVSLALARPDGYTTKWDNIDVDEILHNDRMMENYEKCLLEEGNEKCTPDGKELKAIIPDALKTGCSKCNEKQKAGVEKVLKYLVKERRPLFDKLAAKFDPKGFYLKKFKDEADKHGIKY
uniref:Chemosensory protein 3 n=1 Tax=Nezara viridula TaxID=85310 RepID=A0A4Y5RDL3_NEZVI|nr:chemosensory protein 3 [Nezara viridula]